MNPAGITNLLNSYKARQGRTIVIIDYGNVEKWKHSLRWTVGINQLGRLVRNFSKGNKELRRFYYGSDYGPKESSWAMIGWSKGILEMAALSGFFISTKRVKYIYDNDFKGGLKKKCDFDVEMSVDLIKFRDLYDNIVLFSGDGDLMYVIEYLIDVYEKSCLVFGARNHIGREVFDAKKKGFIGSILFAEDFEYRLNKFRFFK